MKTIRPMMLAAGLALVASTAVQAQVIVHPQLNPGVNLQRPNVFANQTPQGWWGGPIQRPVGPIFQPVVPVRPIGPVINPGFPPREKDIERFVERAIFARFGAGAIEDVDVDADIRRGRLDLEVDVEVRRGVNEALAYQQIHAYLCSLPQLRGMRLDLDVDD